MANFTSQEGRYEQLSRLHRKLYGNTTEHDMMTVNPRFNNQPGKVNNCVPCSVSMEMRRRGYDVIARSSDRGYDLNDFQRWFVYPKAVRPYLHRKRFESKRDYANRCFANFRFNIEGLGLGARGTATVQWKSSPGGHAIYWENKPDGVHFYDGQNKRLNNNEMFASADPTSYTYIRLDNLRLRNGITETCRSNPRR